MKFNVRTYRICRAALPAMLFVMMAAGANAQSIVIPPPVQFLNGDVPGGATDFNRAISGAFVIEPGYGNRGSGPPLAITPGGIYALRGPGIVYDNKLRNGDMPVQYDVYDENSNYNNNYASATRVHYYRPSRVPHDRDKITAQRTKASVTISWKGDPRIVSRIVFALLDRKGKPISQKSVTRLPAHAKFTRTRASAFYGAMIYYIDGKSNTFLSGV